jgi:hypothetical protein
MSSDPSLRFRMTGQSVLILSSSIRMGNERIRHEQPGPFAIVRQYAILSG